MMLNHAEIFAFLAPELLRGYPEKSLQIKLGDLCLNADVEWIKAQPNLANCKYKADVDPISFRDILMAFSDEGLIESFQMQDKNGNIPAWKLTTQGKEYDKNLRAEKRGAYNEKSPSLQ